MLCAKGVAWCFGHTADPALVAGSQETDHRLESWRGCERWADMPGLAAGRSASDALVPLCHPRWARRAEPS